MSLASQHFARAVRSGAMGVPSVEILGAGSLSVELENKPMVYVFGEELFVGVAVLLSPAFSVPCLQVFWLRFDGIEG